MPSRIVLVRHGRSAHVHAGLLSAAEFLRWREAYEAAGIVANEWPPRHLLDIDGVFAASDAPRAVESAKLLARNRDVLISPLLRELELPPPRLPFVRLPLALWALVYGIRLLFRPLATPAEIERAREAAEWLSRLANERTVVAVTHASVRGVIGKALLQSGWMREGRERGSHHWSDWLFVRSSPTARTSSSGSNGLAT